MNERKLLTNRLNLIKQNVGRKPIVFVTVVSLPTGAFETIINHENIEEKIDYILNVYDENLIMKNNVRIQIVEWLLY